MGEREVAGDNLGKASVVRRVVARRRPGVDVESLRRGAAAVDGSRLVVGVGVLADGPEAVGDCGEVVVGRERNVAEADVRRRQGGVGHREVDGGILVAVDFIGVLDEERVSLGAGGRDDLIAARALAEDDVVAKALLLGLGVVVRSGRQVVDRDAVEHEVAVRALVDNLGLPREVFGVGAEDVGIGGRAVGLVEPILAVADAEERVAVRDVDARGGERRGELQVDAASALLDELERDFVEVARVLHVERLVGRAEFAGLRVEEHVRDVVGGVADGFSDDVAEGGHARAVDGRREGRPELLLAGGGGVGLQRRDGLAVLVGLRDARAHLERERQQLVNHRLAGDFDRVDARIEVERAAPGLVAEDALFVRDVELPDAVAFVDDFVAVWQDEARHVGCGADHGVAEAEVERNGEVAAFEEVLDFIDALGVERVGGGAGALDELEDGVVSAGLDERVAVGDDEVADRDAGEREVEVGRGGVLADELALEVLVFGGGADYEGPRKRAVAHIEVVEAVSSVVDDGARRNRELRERHVAGLVANLEPEAARARHLVRPADVFLHPVDGEGLGLRAVGAVLERLVVNLELGGVVDAGGGLLEGPEAAVGREPVLEGDGGSRVVEREVEVGVRGGGDGRFALRGHPDLHRAEVFPDLVGGGVLGDAARGSEGVEAEGAAPLRRTVHLVARGDEPVEVVGNLLDAESDRQRHLVERHAVGELEILAVVIKGRAGLGVGVDFRFADRAQAVRVGVGAVAEVEAVEAVAVVLEGAARQRAEACDARERRGDLEVERANRAEARAVRRNVGYEFGVVGDFLEDVGIGLRAGAARRAGLGLAEELVADDESGGFKRRLEAGRRLLERPEAAVDGRLPVHRVLLASGFRLVEKRRAHVLVDNLQFGAETAVGEEHAVDVGDGVEVARRLARVEAESGAGHAAVNLLGGGGGDGAAVEAGGNLLEEVVRPEREVRDAVDALVGKAEVGARSLYERVVVGEVADVVRVVGRARALIKEIDVRLADAVEGVAHGDAGREVVDGEGGVVYLEVSLCAGRGLRVLDSLVEVVDAGKEDGVGLAGAGAVFGEEVVADLELGLARGHSGAGVCERPGAAAGRARPRLGAGGGRVGDEVAAARGAALMRGRVHLHRRAGVVRHRELLHPLELLRRADRVRVIDHARRIARVELVGAAPRLTPDLLLRVADAGVVELELGTGERLAVRVFRAGNVFDADAVGDDEVGEIDGDVEFDALGVDGLHGEPDLGRALDGRAHQDVAAGDVDGVARNPFERHEAAGRRAGCRVEGGVVGSVADDVGVVGGAVSFGD